MPYTLSSLNADGKSAPSGFRIKRTLATVQGYQAAVDQKVAAQLAELDGFLQKAIVEPGDEALDTVREWVERPLTPRRSAAIGVGRWAEDSLVSALRANKPGAGERTIGEVLDGETDLTDLRYELDDELDARWSTLDFDVRTVLAYEGIRDLVFARAYLVYGIRQRTSLINFVVSHRDGARDVVAYATVGAARDLVQEAQLRVPKLDDDDSTVVTAILARAPKLSVDSFKAIVLDVVGDHLEHDKYAGLIAASGVKDVPPELVPTLVEYLKTSHIAVTKENAPYMVPMYLAKAATSGAMPSAGPDDPFAVTFYGDDAAARSVNSAAVRCAAQLFYVMTLGDELGVFDAVRYFTSTYLFHDGFAVEDPVLRKDLEDYVFSNRFPVLDPRSGTTDKVDATREPMRRAYYRQVFDLGKAPTPADAPANEEFGRLWKILILESARYLERAQVSPHPDNFVSRQNVMQAVEDLQYNLSTSCVGLATVMTPMMNAELDFVITRILGHEEIRSHLVPAGGSWLKVIEKLAATRGQRARASVLNNKARLGHALLTSIAEYTPSAFEQDEAFSRFISNVDAFITTQSILQEDASEHGDDEAEAGGGSGPLPGMPSIPDLPGMPDLGGMPGMPSFGSPPTGAPGTGAGAPASGDDWDF
ncbi:hypothetical protein [Agromyces sp. S2-1-8]|uniref:hypothetical protein n=1 Tax=Agromyces sp. S2-1-8 TaxID=2897180 RepID=UPI001E378C38|nr:hypothetical protein [Agromyces sp. S2-1-8]MCD5344939.1 hypothetical protein [Agromyces sp. S2-1-8]